LDVGKTIVIAFNYISNAKNTFLLISSNFFSIDKNVSRPAVMLAYELLLLALIDCAIPFHRSWHCCSWTRGNSSTCILQISLIWML